MAQFLHASIQIREPGSSPPSYIDVTQYVDNISLDHGNVQQVGTESGGGDGVVKTLTLNLISTNNYNLSPFDETSPANIYNAEYHPLLSEMSEIIIWVAKIESKNPPAPESADWYLFFRGYVDAVTVNGARVTCNARDPAGILQDTFVEQPTEFPLTQQDEPLHVVLQQMLDELVPENITIYTPSGTTAQPIHPNEAPEFMVRYPGPDEERYGLEDESVWSGLQAAVTQAGWFLGYRYHDPDDPGTPPDIRLVLLEPPVDAGSNTDPATVPGWNHWEYGPEHDFIISPQAGRTLDYIRNVVEIDYSDDHVMRPPVIRFDQDSIDRYRRRYMKITRHNCRLVKYEAEAIKMAEWALYDLKDPFGTFSAEGFFEPGMQVFDGITYLDSRISAGFQFMAVQSIRHTLKFGDRPSFRTRVEGQASVKGGRMKWLWIESRPEADPSIKEDEVGTRKPMIPPQQPYAESIVGGIGVKFLRPDTRRWSDTSLYIIPQNNPEGEYLYTRAKVTHFEVISGLTLGEYYKAKLINHDESGNSSEPAETDFVVAHDYPIADLPIPGDPTFDAASAYTRTGLRLLWNPTSYAAGYEIRTDTNWGNTANRIARVASSSFTFTPATRDITLYIRAYNANFEYSANFDSITRNNPEPAQMSAPTVSHSYYTAIIDFSALVDDTIASYELEIEYGQDSKVITVPWDIAGNTYRYELNTGGPMLVKARVRAKDVQGFGSWSVWEQTDVAWPVPDTPTNLSAEFVWDVFITWDAMPHADYYELRLDPDNNGTGLITKIIKGNSYRITNPDVRIYGLEVRAFNIENVASNWSSKISVSKPAPLAPNPGVVDAHSFFRGVRVTINSSSSAGILHYVIRWGLAATTPAERDTRVVAAGARYLLEAESGQELVIEVKAVDVVGAGDWSTAQTKSTITLDPIDIPDNIIEESNLVTALQTEIGKIEGLETEVAGKITTFRQTTAPTSQESSEGDLWIDISLNEENNPKNELYRYDGTNWILAKDDDFSLIFGRLGAAEGDLDTVHTYISTLSMTASELNTTFTEIWPEGDTQLNSSITQNATEIALRVTQTDFDILEGTVGEIEGDLENLDGVVSGNTAYIGSLSMTATELNTTFMEIWPDGNTQLVSNIQQNATEISLTVAEVFEDGTGSTSKIQLLSDEYTVKLAGYDSENNKVFAGFGLALEAGDSEFAIVADRFRVYTPNFAGETGGTPIFSVVENEVYILGDLIADGSIHAQSLKLGDYMTIDPQDGLTIENINADIITAGTIDISDGITITTGTLSHEFILNDTGLVITTPQFTLDTLGNATFSGELSATSGNIAGWAITSDRLEAGTGSTTRGISTDVITFYAGSETPMTAPFYVTSLGALFSTNLYVNSANVRINSDGISIGPEAGTISRIATTGEILSFVDTFYAMNEVLIGTSNVDSYYGTIAAQIRAPANCAWDVGYFKVMVNASATDSISFYYKFPAQDSPIVAYAFVEVDQNREWTTSVVSDTYAQETISLLGYSGEVEVKFGLELVVANGPTDKSVFYDLIEYESAGPSFIVTEGGSAVFRGHLQASTGEFLGSVKMHNNNPGGQIGVLIDPNTDVPGAVGPGGMPALGATIKLSYGAAETILSAAISEFTTIHTKQIATEDAYIGGGPHDAFTLATRAKMEIQSSTSNPLLNLIATTNAGTDASLLEGSIASNTTNRYFMRFYGTNNAENFQITTSGRARTAHVGTDKGMRNISFGSGSPPTSNVIAGDVHLQY